jgi:cardiolipin synthase
MKKYLILLLFLSLFTSCSVGPRTITYDLVSLTEDHTVGIASNPFSATGSLLSRIKVFTAETLWRVHIKCFGYPLLNPVIPIISKDRKFLNKDKFNKWLDRKITKTVKGDIRTFVSGDNFFPVLEKNILNANKFINISTYIFDNDKYGIFFADLLKEKSKTVQVKVVIDLLGSAGAWDISDDKAGLSSMESKHMFYYLTENSKIKLRKSKNIWLASDHVKIISIDGDKIFFGGMNIGNEYRYEWRDMMFEVKGDLVKEFQEIFDSAWAKHRHFADFLRFFKKKLKKEIPKQNIGDTDFHILKTTTYKQEIYAAQIEAVRRAKHHIYVENPYIWNETFIYELCAARNRGVDVRVTIPGDFDAKSFAGINKKVTNVFLKYGIRVYIYPGTSHIKAASYDGWVCFGTANYDDLSLHKNYEVNLATSDPLFSEKFERDVLIKGQNISTEQIEPFTIEMSDRITYELKDFF